MTITEAELLHLAPGLHARMVQKELRSKAAKKTPKLAARVFQTRFCCPVTPSPHQYRLCSVSLSRFWVHACDTAPHERTALEDWYVGKVGRRTI